MFIMASKGVFGPVLPLPDDRKSGLYRYLLTWFGYLYFYSFIWFNSLKKEKWNINHMQLAK